MVQFSIPAEGRKTMVGNCEQVWREISNYLESDLDPVLRAGMDEHLKQCPHCRAILEGTRNVIQIYGDERLFQVPLGFSWRLRHKLAAAKPAWRSVGFGWLVAAAAMALIVAGFFLANSYSSRPTVLSHMAAPIRPLPPDLVVVVAENGKLFHLAKCSYIHAEGRPVRIMTAREALHKGYMPCVRCLGEYVVKVAMDFVYRAAHSSRSA
jgi:hypothetical protein